MGFFSKIKSFFSKPVDEMNEMEKWKKGIGTESYGSMVKTAKANEAKEKAEAKLVYQEESAKMERGELDNRRMGVDAHIQMVQEGIKHGDKFDDATEAFFKEGDEGKALYDKKGQRTYTTAEIMSEEAEVAEPMKPEIKTESGYNEGEHSRRRAA